MRIITRPDFDGVVCAVLLYEAFNVKQPVIWMEPNDLHAGKVEIRSGDIIANLPYDEKCALWFDHHYTNRIYKPFKGGFKIAPSASGIIFDLYKDRFKRDFSELVAAADKIDSADLTLDEVLHPENYDYVLLSMTVSDGVERDEPYWNRLIELFRKFEIQQILDDPEVKKRCRTAVTQNEKYLVYLKEYTRLNKHVSITDFRNLDATCLGNRFLVYSLFPDSVVNLRIRYEDMNKKTVVLNVGHSIFNRKCNVNVGLMLSEFGGGGHHGAGSCRFPVGEADANISRIIDILLNNENNEASA